MCILLVHSMDSGVYCRRIFVCMPLFLWCWGSYRRRCEAGWTVRPSMQCSPNAPVLLLTKNAYTHSNRAMEDRTSSQARQQCRAEQHGTCGHGRVGDVRQLVAESWQRLGRL